MKKALMIFLLALMFFPSCGNNKKSGESVKPHSISTPQTRLNSTDKPQVNVFIENSGSMFGYIHSGNDFDRSISSLLTRVQISDYSDSIGLFYINSRTYKQNVDQSTFIRNINIHNAKTWPGNLSRTDMCELFDTIVSRVNANAISIFVTDGIFSPGKGVDASKYIGTEKDCIARTINQRLKNQNLAFVVYRLTSDFKGYYFDCQDNRTHIDDIRPFFIWVIGTKENIKSFNHNVPANSIEGKVENSHTIYNNERNLSYAVQLNPKIGDFERTTPTSIKRTKKDRDSGKLMFAVAVDFSTQLVDESYLTDPNNYFINNPNYKIEIIKKPMGNHTHLIKVSTTSKIISPAKLSIKLINKIPSWVDEYSDDSCGDINSDGMMHKTYGLKQIVQGIYSAYNFEEETLTEILISINQN